MEAQEQVDPVKALDDQIAGALPWLREVTARGDEFGLQPDGKFVLPLQDAVKKGIGTIDRLTFRPCNGADLRWFGNANQASDLGRLLSLAGRMTGEIDTVLDRLSARDAHRVCEVAAAFFFGSTEMLGGAS